MNNEEEEGLARCQGWCRHHPLMSQRVEDQVNVRKEELEELFAQMPSLGEEAGDEDLSIEKRFLDLLEPLGRRKKQLESSRAKLQISRDLEDETVSRHSGPPASPAVIGVAGCCPGQFLAGDVWSSHHLISQGGCNDYIKHESKPVPFEGRLSRGL